LAGLRVLLAVVASLLAAEGIARLYVDHVARQGKLFAADPRLGWRVLPHLDVVRRNADGAPWRVTTDAGGWRRPATFRPGAARRVLVLGDSSAFGQGVDVGDRFDSVLEAESPPLTVVNLGVMGYGPDQELIGSRLFRSELRDGDWLVVLAHGSDFWDLLQHRHAGRAKPWFELAGGRLVEHAPEHSWRERLRDRSYVLSVAERWLHARGPRPPPEAFERARDLYRLLLTAETAPLLDRGVRILVAHHWDHPEGPAFDVRGFFETLVREGFRCLALDDVLGPRPGPNLQADGHWTAAGHLRVAAALRGILDAQPAVSGPSGARRPDTSADAAIPTTSPKNR
jgi:hypothetical protein